MNVLNIYHKNAEVTGYGIASSVSGKTFDCNSEVIIKDEVVGENVNFTVEINGEKVYESSYKIPYKYIKPEGITQ